MKKTLIALAALAAVGTASAQSSVTIFGAVDAGYKSVNNSANSAANSNNITNNNTATTLMIFKGVEDIGGGMAATFLMELDFNPTNSSSQNAAPGAAGANYWNGTPFNGEQYIGISGGFGNLQLGTPNADGLIAGIIAQPFGTAMGSGFNGTFGRLGTQAVSSLNQFDGNAGTNGRIIRHANTVQYTTPSFSGFTATAGYAFGNDNNAAATLGGNTNTYSTLSLKYNNGPINAMYVYTNEKASSNGANGIFGVVAGTVANTGVFATTTTPTLPANTDITWNQLSANYTFGAATVYGGWSNTKHNAAVALEDSSSWNLAGKYAVTPAIDLAANYLVRSTNITNVAKASVLGLGADYKFSKRTNAYFRYEGINFDSTPIAASSTLNSWAVGLKHTF
jgi:predicted porin